MLYEVITRFGFQLIDFRLFVIDQLFETFDLFVGKRDLFFGDLFFKLKRFHFTLCLDFSTFLAVFFQFRRQFCQVKFIFLFFELLVFNLLFSYNFV